GCVGKKLFGILAYKHHARCLAKELNAELVLASTIALPAALKIGQDNRIPVGTFVRAYENFNEGGANNFRIRLKNWLKKSVMGQYRGSALNRSTFLLPNSKYMAQKCRELFPDPAVYVVYPPIECPQNEFHAPLSIRNICMVGASKKKGFEIFQSLARGMPLIQFHTVGDPEIRPGNVEIDRNLTRSGWVSDTAEFIGNADLVLVPSIWNEPFGRVAVEALRHGRIVLVSRYGGLPEAVGFQSRLIVDSNNVDSWMERILEVDAAPELFIHDCVAAAGMAKQYSIDEQSKVLENALIEEVSRSENA
ncbi:MAG: glycosyltransferase, partial [Candidatus Aegiribacteria sp.]|nr:glycosyltransferase [Candidatus Aegiribacteria sp.]